MRAAAVKGKAPESMPKREVGSQWTWCEQSFSRHIRTDLRGQVAKQINQEGKRAEEENPVCSE